MSLLNKYNVNVKLIKNIITRCQRRFLTSPLHFQISSRLCFSDIKENVWIRNNWRENKKELDICRPRCKYLLA
jgi:hypothetical protein